MPGSFIEVGVTHAGDSVVVAPAGEIDIATAPVVREVLRAARSAGTLVLDLRGVEFMDTAGLQILVEERRHALERGDPLEVVPGPQSLRRLLDVTGLSATLVLVDAPEEVAARDGLARP